MHTQLAFDAHTHPCLPVCAPPRPAVVQGIKELDRNHLPWTRYPEERDVLIIEGVTDATMPVDY